MQRRVVASELPLARCRWSYQLGWAAFAVFVVSVLLSAIATRTSAAERQQQAAKDAAAVLQARVSPPPQTQTVYYVVVGGGGPQATSVLPLAVVPSAPPADAVPGAVPPSLIPGEYYMPQLGAGPWDASSAYASGGGVATAPVVHTNLDAGAVHDPSLGAVADR